MKYYTKAKMIRLLLYPFVLFIVASILAPERLKEFFNWLIVVSMITSFITLGISTVILRGKS